MIPIFPKPKSVKIVSNNTKLFNSFYDGNFNLSPYVKKELKSDLIFDENSSNILSFFEDNSLNNEGYKIIVNRDIKIYSSSDSGYFYAIKTLYQLLLQNGNKLPEMVIEDEPTYKYRGFMLDVGRYFYSVQDVKKIIDRMANHKLNYFHFHLTEDQGWRIEIKKHPLLTEIGSRRYKTNFFGKAENGYYTQEDIKEIVEYAHSKFIKVVPEFDIPGHSRAAIAAYNELTCFPRDLPVATHWGVKHDVLCAGKEDTYRFVFDVIDEMSELFTDGIFHIGGDEVPKHRWNLCPNCKKIMAENKLKNADELQFYFMNRVNDYLQEKGIKSFMWNWDLGSDTSKLDKNIGFTLCSYDKNSKPEEDRTVIDTSSSAYYIDMPYGYVSLKDSANHIPPKTDCCIGIEAELWSEYVPNMKKADYMTFPRLGAICETAWNGKNSYLEFEKDLQSYYNLLDKFGYGYATKKAINPNGLRKFASILWFEKRQLVWEGLKNIFDDKYIEKRAKKEEK